MKYMLMIINDERRELALPAAQIEQLVAEHGEFHRALAGAGRYVDSHRLRPTTEAATIRYRDGAAIVVDGPFAESKEVLGGFYLIDAPSRADAIAWANRLPLSKESAVEVRPARTGAQWRGKTQGRKYMIMFIASVDQPMTVEALFEAIDNHYELSLVLAAQGKFVGSRALEPSPAAATVRPGQGMRTVTDGPFAESKEFVAGYFVIACDSRQEAIDWAAKIGRGSRAVEVRPVWSS